jgi:hypothetical protein
MVGVTRGEIVKVLTKGRHLKAFEASIAKRQFYEYLKGFRQFEIL